MTLAEAINLKSIISQKQRELSSTRNNVSVVNVPTKNSEYNDPMYTVEELTSELEEVIENCSELTEILSKVNVENTLEFRGKNVSISYALDMVKHLRTELNALKILASRNKETFNNHYGDSSYEIAMYDPKIYEMKAKELEREVNKLSIKINTNNYNVFVVVPFGHKYLD